MSCMQTWNRVICNRENTDAVNGMLEAEYNILEDSFNVVRCVEGIFQGEKVHSKSTSFEKDKDGFSWLYNNNSVFSS